MKKKRKIIKHDDLTLKVLEALGQSTLFEIEKYLPEKSGGAESEAQSLKPIRIGERQVDTLIGENGDI